METRPILLAMADLVKVDANLYVSKNTLNEYIGSRAIGGQLICQALLVAVKNKKPGYYVHSLHCYFIRGCVTGVPIVLEAKDVKYGATFISQTVVVRQRGRTVCSVAVMLLNDSRQKPAIRHQFQKPDCSPPDQLQSSGELLLQLADRAQVGGALLDYVNRTIRGEMSFELRPVNPTQYLKLNNFIGTRPRSDPDARQLCWMRLNETLAAWDVDARDAQCCVAAYLTDWNYPGTSMLPHKDDTDTFPLSVDHSMWFHADFSFNEWMLYEMESPVMAEGCSLVLGRVWKLDGTLAMSVAQAGIIVNTGSKL